MKKRFLFFIILITVAASLLQAQKNDSLFQRLQAISNGGLNFYNVDGIEITSQAIDKAFSKENIIKKYKKLSIKKSDLNLSDSLILSQNFYLSKSEEIISGTIRHTAYYFIENKNKGITAITFGSINRADKEFENYFVALILNDKIPESVYTPLQIDSINFSGRKIALGNACNWMGINNVQCPYNGQMNWSVHKTLEDASKSATDQYNIIKVKKGGKIIAEELVNVIFEGVSIKAKKVIYDIKGLKSLLVGMSGGKTLTIYFVAAPATKNYVSCAMSFWNNDYINKSGLPALLDEVMSLSK